MLYFSSMQGWVQGPGSSSVGRGAGILNKIKVRGHPAAGPASAVPPAGDQRERDQRHEGTNERVNELTEQTNGPTDLADGDTLL